MRTTATTATPGRTSPTTWRGHAPIDGARTASPASPTISNACASSVALWNEHDPILKERLFGLTNAEGNHGEDVKEYYFYVDNVPSHAYQRLLYKYPQAAFPYEDLVDTNAHRSRTEMEYELLDTGVFDDDRYFDVEVEYAKAATDDIVCRITVHNRGPEAAPLHVLPTLWFRNTWSWAPFDPPSSALPATASTPHVVADHHELGTWYWHIEHGRRAPVLRQRDQRGQTLGRPERQCLSEGRRSTMRRRIAT